MPLTIVFGASSGSGSGVELAESTASVKSNQLAGTTVLATLTSNVPNSSPALTQATNSGQADGTAAGRFAISGGALVTGAEPLSYEDGATQTVIAEAISADLTQAVRGPVVVTVQPLTAGVDVSLNPLTLSESAHVISGAPKGHPWATVNAGRCLGTTSVLQGRVSLANADGSPYIRGKVFYEDNTGFFPARPDAIRQADQIGLAVGATETVYLLESVGGVTQLSGPFTFTGVATAAPSNPTLTLTKPGMVMALAPKGAPGVFGQLIATTTNPSDAITWKKVRVGGSVPDYLDCFGDGRLHPVQSLTAGTVIQETFVGTNAAGQTCTYTTNLTVLPFDASQLGGVGGFDATTMAAQTGVTTIAGHQGVTWTVTGSPNIDANGVECNGSTVITTADSRLLGLINPAAPTTNNEIFIAFQIDDLTVTNAVLKLGTYLIFGVGPSGIQTCDSTIANTQITTGTVHTLRIQYLKGALTIRLDNGGAQLIDVGPAGANFTGGVGKQTAGTLIENDSPGTYSLGSGAQALRLGVGMKGKILAVEVFPGCTISPTPIIRSWYRNLVANWSSTIAAQTLPLELARGNRSIVYRETFDHPDYTYATSPYLQKNGGPWSYGCYSNQNRTHGGTQNSMATWFLTNVNDYFPGTRYAGGPSGQGGARTYGQSGSSLTMRVERNTYNGMLLSGDNDAGTAGTFPAADFINTGGGLNSQNYPGNPRGQFAWGGCFRFEKPVNFYFDAWLYSLANEDEFDLMEPTGDDSLYASASVITTHTPGGGNSNPETTYALDLPNPTPEYGDYVYLHVETSADGTYSNYYHNFDRVASNPTPSADNYGTQPWDMLVTYGSGFSTSTPPAIAPYTTPAEACIDMIETLGLVNTLTASSVPSAVSQLQTQTTSTSITILAAPAEPNGSAITGYNISYTPSGGSQVTLSGVALPYTISGLTPALAYTLSAAAVNGGGAGAASMALKLTLPSS